MDIRFNKEYKSIPQQDTIKLPDCFVLTGKNGSGKTHLLEGIKNGDFVIDEIGIDDILLFDYTNFLVSDGVDGATSVSRENKLLEYRKNKKIFLDGMNKEILGGQIDGWGRDSESAHHNKDLLGIDPCILLTQYIFKNIFLHDDFFIPNIIDKIVLKHGQNSSPITAYVNYSEIITFLQNKIKNDVKYNKILQIERVHGKEIESLTQKVIPSGLPFLKVELIKNITTWYKNFARYNSSNYEENIGKISQLDFRKTNPDPVFKINEILDKINYSKQRLKVINPYITLDEFHLYSSNVQITNDGLNIEFSDLSSGEKILFGLAIFLSEKENLSKKVLLLDEVDATLHPSMARKVIESIEDISEEFGFKTIMTSHSPSTVSYAKNICLMDNKQSPAIKIVDNHEAIDSLSDGMVLSKNNVKTVLVEGNAVKKNAEEDCTFYTKMYEMCVKKEYIEKYPSLIFVPRDSIDKVVDTVKTINDAGIKAYGLVDGDDTADGKSHSVYSKDGIQNKNVLRLSRYCIENYYYDPLALLLLLIQTYRYKDKINCDSYRDFIELSNVNKQKMIDIVIGKIKAEIIKDDYPRKKINTNNDNKIEVEYSNPKIKITIPKWVLITKGKFFVQYIQKVIEEGQPNDNKCLPADKNNVREMIYIKEIIPKCIVDIFSDIYKMD